MLHKLRIQSSGRTDTDTIHLRVVTRSTISDTKEDITTTMLFVTILLSLTEL